jgi:exopolysaccharide production protein ExoZ
MSQTLPQNELDASGRPKIELTYIQMLRGVAASLVVFTHFGDLPAHSWVKDSGFSQLGTSGVDLFFVISGFIMVYTTRGLAGGSDALQFLRKRVHRIYPLYWLWTTVLLVLWLCGLAYTSHRFPIAYIVGSYTLIPSYLEGAAYPFFPLLIQGWTLSFEMLFYLVFAAGILIDVKRWLPIFLAGSFALLWLAGRPLSPHSGLKYLVSSTIVIEFLFGVLAAQMILPMAKYGRSVAISLMCAGAFLFLCSTVFHSSADWTRFLVYGIPAATLVLGAAMMGSRPMNKALLYLGNASYSIYLSHFFFALAFGWALKHTQAMDRVQPDLLIVAMTAATIALSSLTYPLERLIQFKRVLPDGPATRGAATSWRTYRS